MKKLLIILLLYSSSIYSQSIYSNRYCVDTLPFKEGECDLEGESNSSVIIKDKFLTLSFIGSEFIYQMKSLEYEEGTKNLLFTLFNDQGDIKMLVAEKGNKVTFIYPSSKITLYVSKVNGVIID